MYTRNDLLHISNAYFINTINVFKHKFKIPASFRKKTLTTAFLYTAGRLPKINMGRLFYRETLPEAWRHLSVPAWTIYLVFHAAANLTPPSSTPQNHSVPHIARCSNLPHVTSQCNVARDWVATRRSASAVIPAGVNGAPNTTDS